MRKKILILALMLAMALPVAISAADTGDTSDAYKAPSTFRTWKYFNFTTVLSKNWAFVVMPGQRYEHYRTGLLPAGDGKVKSAAKGNFYQELFVGPVYMTKLTSSLKFKLPVWYYLMEFPNNNENIFFSHNLAVMPILVWTTGKFSLINRLLLHNTVYTTFYEANGMSGDPAGYSLLLRYMIKTSYKVAKTVSVHTAGEIFYGLKDNGDDKRPAVFGPGFVPTGFLRSRVYAGFKWKFAPGLSLTPEYIWERNVAYKFLVDKSKAAGQTLKTGEVVETNHYFKFVISYTLNLIKKSAPKKEKKEVKEEPKA